jgi:hypothetical protein
MLTNMAVLPQLVAVRPVGFRPTPYDWVPLAVIILLIVVFVLVYSRGGPSRNHGHRRASRRRPNRP